MLREKKKSLKNYYKRDAKNIRFKKKIKTYNFALLIHAALSLGGKRRKKKREKKISEIYIIKNNV